MTCIHYWLVEPPEGPTSPGCCRYCGAIREFVNTPADALPVEVQEMVVDGKRRRHARLRPVNLHSEAPWTVYGRVQDRRL